MGLDVRAGQSVPEILARARQVPMVSARAVGPPGRPGPTGPEGPEGPVGPAGRGLEAIRGTLFAPTDLPPGAEIGDAYLMQDGSLWIYK